MQELFHRFDEVLGSQDVLAVAREVDQLTRVYMSRSADPASRLELASLLEQKAGESSNLVLTNYLRTVAICIREQQIAIRAAPRMPKCIGMLNNSSMTGNAVSHRLGNFWPVTETRKVTDQGENATKQRR